MVTLCLALRFRRWFLFYCTCVVLFLFLTLRSLHTGLCSVLSFTLFYLSFLPTLFFVISSAPSIWSVLFHLLVFPLRIFLLCYLFCGVLPLNPYLPALFATLPGRSSFCFLWPLLVGLGSFRLCLHRCHLRVMTCFCLTCLSFGRRRSPLFVLSLALFRCALFAILWALFLMNSSCVRSVLFAFTCPVLLLFLLVLVPFLSPRSPTRSLSKNALSFFIREVIAEAYSSAGRSLPFAPSLSSSSVSSSSRPRSSICAHGVRGVVASWPFHRNAPLSSILESATWFSSVFSSFYLFDVQFSSSSGYGLGPVVAAGSVV